MDDLSDEDWEKLFEAGPGEVMTPFGPRPMRQHGLAHLSDAKASKEDWQQPDGLFSVADLASRTMRPRPMLVPDMIPGNQVSSIDGDGGAGKSTVGLQLCAAAPSGRSWLGQHVMHGPAIYLASEDDKDELHRRMDAITVHYRLGLSDLADMHIWSLAQDEPALVVAGRDDSLQPTSKWYELVGLVEHIKPIVLVLDSRADVFGGNEISRTQARSFIGMLRKLAIQCGVAVVILGHPSLSGMSSGSGSSGSTHWRNAVRAGLYLRQATEDEGPPDHRVIEVRKANYAPTGLKLTLRWSAGVYDLVEDGLVTPRHQATSDVDNLFLTLLAAFDAQGRSVSHNTGRAYAPSLFAKDPIAKGTTSRGFEAAMSRLFNAGSIRVATKGPPSRQVSFIERVHP